MFVVLATTHGILNTSKWINNLGRKKEPQASRSIEDFLLELQRVSATHEKQSTRLIKKASSMKSKSPTNERSPKLFKSPSPSHKHDSDDDEDASEGNVTEKEEIAQVQRRRESAAGLRRRSTTSGGSKQ